jgi:hypothetical protein
MPYVLESSEYQHIRTGLAELEAGEDVSNEHVMEWLDSWGSEDELPAPKWRSVGILRSAINGKSGNGQGH